MDTNHIFSFPIDSKQKEFITIGIEPPENRGQPYRILARTTEDTKLKEIYVFYSTDKTFKNMTFIRKYT